MATRFTVEPMERQRRHSRRPTHTFNITNHPWRITPFLIAPVLPGESLVSGRLQLRAITNPVINRFQGWWLEHHFFYVAMRDMDGRDDFTAALLEPGYDLSAYEAGADQTNNYNHDGGMTWLDQAYEVIVREYFRTEEEGYTHTPGGLAYAKVGTAPGWLSSGVSVNELGDEADLDVDLDADATITAGEVDKAMALYQFKRMQGLTQMSYEDYLVAAGVREKTADLHIPELLRSSRAWQMPTAAIDPTDGSAVSSVKWEIRETFTRKRFFDEPGFIIGLSVLRPKIYFSNINGGLVGELKDALDWVPQMLNEYAEAGKKRFTAGTGPMPGLTDDYEVDLRDLFFYGDQFINRTATNISVGALPTATFDKLYGTDAMGYALFVGGDGYDRAFSDGLVSLNIMTHLKQLVPPRHD